MTKNEIIELTILLEQKIKEIEPQNNPDVLLTKSILTFLLYLANEEKQKHSSSLVASEDDVYQLTHFSLDDNR